MEHLRYRIIAARMEWVAATEAAQRQPAAAQDAVSSDRLLAVARTGRRKAAGRREQRRDRELIKADQPNRQSFHRPPSAACGPLIVMVSRARRKSSSTAPRSADQSATALGARARNTRSQLGVRSIRRRRTASRIRRRTRFRTTALPTRRLTTTPSRGCPSSLDAVFSTRSELAQDRLLARTCWKSADPRSRYARCMPVRPAPWPKRQSVACGRVGAAAAGRSGRRGCSSSSENRARACAESAWVDRCASSTSTDPKATYSMEYLSERLGDIAIHGAPRN